MILKFLILCALLLFIEYYSYQAFRALIKLRWVLISYQVISLLILIFIIYSFSQIDRSVGQTKQFMFTTGLMLLVYVPKIVLTLFMFGEDIFRIGVSIVNYFVYNVPKKEMMPERRKFISQIALGLAAVPFLSLIYGIFEGKYNFKVIKQTVFFPDLPDAFDGFKITQISDVHSGSFDNPDKINYAIDLINAQESDLILFTGDIVNTHAKEMHPWLETFKRIKNYKYGKFSVLGNHDYGEYVTWPSEKDKKENFEEIKSLYGQIGFELLLNEHRYIQKGDDKIALIGVENWGKNFAKYGDIDKASQNVSQDDFKVVMSHDPTHWEYVIKDHPKNFHLTLSGHTHGMQFGIEIPGYFKWSLAQYIYKQWAGLYENASRYVYVNRGFGFHAYPGRVGIMPEITVIELKKGNNVA
ncbi:metallophosphoesterase [Flavobacterium tructae]|uniref:Phosphoesterase n=1 Tax=Flavobacterium tructae TaxID=1114873 RepID=A0A1S1J8Y0_9FLAO|nr:metallophosphoesterase [Flavobacterium tructae]OHT45959.1 phosphoesterase [Flavobacterium tructae]OXB21917.1 phosphoesterase [Flavobacterium tructae]